MPGKTGKHWENAVILLFRKLSESLLKIAEFHFTHNTYHKKLTIWMLFAIQNHEQRILMEKLWKFLDSFRKG